MEVDISLFRSREVEGSKFSFNSKSPIKLGQIIQSNTSRSPLLFF